MIGRAPDYPPLGGMAGDGCGVILCAMVTAALTLVPRVVEESVGGAVVTDHQRFLDGAPTWAVHQRFSVPLAVADDIMEPSERVKAWWLRGTRGLFCAPVA